MRVLHVNKLYHPWIGGIEIAVPGLAEAMTERVEVQVLGCVPKGRGRSCDHNGVPVTLASSLGMFMGMPLSPTLPFLLARMSRWANVVHLHFPFPIGALAWLMLGSRRAKLVIHYHSDLVRQKGFLALYRWLARAILRRSDAIIVTSPGLRDHSRILTGLTDRCNTELPTGVPWVSVDRETGITVPPRDPEALQEALKTLFADSPLRTRLGQAGTARAREFGKDRVVAQILDLYGKVTDR